MKKGTMYLTSSKKRKLGLLMVLGIAVCIVIYGLGGFTQLKREDFIGYYYSARPFGIEILILRENGEYTQLVDVNAPEESFVHHGKWEFREDFGTLDLRNPISLGGGFEPPRDFRTPGKDSIWALKPTWSWFHRVALSYSPDLDLKFEKLDHIWLEKKWGITG